MGKLYLISGNDEFVIKAKTLEIIHSLCGEDYESNPSLEIIRGDSEELKAKAILIELFNSVNTITPYQL